MNPSDLRPMEFLQRQVGWQFDLRSAIIGALVAWIIAGLIYSQRAAIVSLGKRFWTPIAAWRRRIQASQEEKYIRALLDALRPLLLLAPRKPEMVFHPPTFEAFAPLPTTIAEVAQSPRTVLVRHPGLTQGHPKVVITGSPGTGRTTSLVMSARQAAQATAQERPYTQLPIWIDLALMKSASPDSKASGLQKLAQLASTFLPSVLPKWLVRHLRNEPTLILLDNWGSLSTEERSEVAAWIAEADAETVDAIWIVASPTYGYGSLMEIGFMPARLVPNPQVALLSQLAQGWSEILSPDGSRFPLEDEVLISLTEAMDGGAPLWELHLRIVHYLKTGDLPVRQSEVLEQFVITKLSNADLGKGREAWSEKAIDIARQVLVEIAAAQRFEGQEVTGQQIQEIIESLLPPKSERPRRFETLVRRALAESGMLDQDRKIWRICHPIFRDYLAACSLAEAEAGQETLKQHLQDPDWRILSEFYAGLADARYLAEELLATSRIDSDRDALLRAARWGVVSDPDQTWRRDLIKALAQAFMEIDLSPATRLSIGHALGLVAGAGARAFFLKMLRQPAIDIRCSALRGVGWSGTQRDMALLAAALRDDSPEVQISAVDALCDLGTPGAVAFLEESLPQVDETLMLTIAEALASLPIGWDALEGATRYPDLLVRRAAAHGLGQIDEPWATERLLEIAREDPEWLVRSAAETAIQAQEEQAQRQARIVPPPEVSQMDWLIAWAARQGQGLGVGEAAREMLLRAAQEGNVDAKVLSALTLAQIGRRTDIPLLEILRREQNADVQRAAMWAEETVAQRYNEGP